jgi:cell division protein FtsB
VNQIAAQLRISLDNFEEQEKVAKLALKELYVIKADDFVYPTKKEYFR